MAERKSSMSMSLDDEEPSSTCSQDNITDQRVKTVNFKINGNGKVQTVENEAAQPLVSKRQVRKEEKNRLWEASKQLRRENRRKKKQEQKEKRKNRVDQLKIDAEKEGIDPSTIASPATRKKLKSNSMKNSSCKVGICVDMSFSDLMIDKDLHKCIKQLSRCYSANRRFENPVQLHVTSLTGKSAEVMEKQDGWKNWDVYYHEKTYLDLDEYPKDKIVYLTAESENVLTQPENDKMYVIGGLVDHNSLKGLCHKLAVEKGVQHARLPLGEYVEMNRRKVLSILHVFQIIGGVAQNRSWSEVLMEVLPLRNEAKLKTNSSEDEDGDDEDEEGVGTNIEIKDEDDEEVCTNIEIKDEDETDEMKCSSTIDQL